MANKDEFDLTSDNEIKNPIPTKNEDNISSGNIQPPTTPLNNQVLTSDEEKDPNKIEVVISDPSPVVVLFGARTSGKTMTLVRLTRYLRTLGYKIEPERIFRPSNSKHYEEMCDEFDKNINANDILAEGTSVISFMLVKVMNNNGEPICQILEAPGEHYFDEKHPKNPFPRYINSICTTNNPKTWVFIVEKDWKDPTVRNNYAKKIIDMESQIESNDKIIFTCHKADLHPALLPQGNPNVQQFFKDIKNQYEGIFEKYLNKTPIINWFRKYNFDFVVFSAGMFNKTKEGGQTYNPGKDKYPAMLWKAILKTVKGGWF
ncbi:MAG: hypothetical protein IPG55_00525 [Saprospiraceae bacterium]|nr:hypothetical protein [Candidatus Defluviibacterium haderslevense]MBK7243824.1 hypothetical protein [Candidatus Defluviibacterium haderslevense]